MEDWVPGKVFQTINGQTIEVLQEFFLYFMHIENI